MKEIKKIKFALIGWGWRAQFYYRIAALLPQQFELTSVLCRSREKGEAIAREFSVNTTYSLEEMLEDKPDFVVLSIKRGAVSGFLEELFAKAIPVLTETPPAESVEELCTLWEASQKGNARVQVAEQYLYQPLYRAWLEAVRQGLLGEIQNISLSALHGYHGASILRLFLGVGFESLILRGKKYTFQLTETFGRGGPVFDGQVVPSTRVRFDMEFEKGKAAFFDFSDPAQYHSFIRTRQLNIQGTRGEIDDLTIRYLTPDNLPVTQELRRVDMGVYNNQEWSHSALYLGERKLYETPFPYARLNDDELAVATCLKGMAQYLETGEEVYSLRDALQDTYISLLMDRAAEAPFLPVKSEPMPWMNP